MIRFFLSLIILSLNVIEGFSQYNIVQKANVPGTLRHHAAGFSVNGKGYIGTGSTQTGGNLADWNEYDPATNTWKQKANFPSTARTYAVGFSINGKGYITCGNTTTGYLNSLWQYDPAADTWVQKTSFPGAGRRHPCVAVVNGEAYVGCGDGANSSQFKDFYKYNPTTDSWAAIPDFPGTARHHPVAVSLGGKLYVGTGHDLNNVKCADFYVYDPATNSWSGISSMPGIGRIAPAGIVLNNKMLVMWGGNEGSTTYSDYFSYDPATSSWATYNYTANVPLFASVFFEINGKGYAGSGQYQTTNENEFYEITDLNATGIVDNLNTSAEVSVYPNPFCESTTIALQNFQCSEIIIVDVFGKAVRTVNVEPGNQNLNLDRGNLASGIYFYKIVDESTVVASGKLVVE